MDAGTVSEQAVFAEELRILKAAKADVAKGRTPEPHEFEQLTRHYEKLLKTTMKLSRISDIQGRTLKEREQELKAAHSELQHVEQLRRQLISDISHELRTPITSVQGYVKAFLDDVIPPDESYLKMIYQKLLTISDLISDLFQLSTLKANQLRFHFNPVPVALWFSALQGKYALEAARCGVELTVGPDIGVDAGTGASPERAHIVVDSLRIEQVVTNFVDNALKFTPHGGSVRITGRLTAEPPDAAPPIEHAGERKPPLWFTLAVEDTGPGIPAEELPRIFDRFYRGGHSAARGVQGTGLGLAIAKEIVAQHGGRIGAVSAAGAGSRFLFAVPAFHDAADADGNTPDFDTDRSKLFST
ncbi:sensor histidine kinase [Paenibacillus flagellatus]|uniref:histidine kinase n=1 Tax=Paenibacillus flagellatus TaxID=2211139 RepID=A0A2V5K038_9BACL|nr:HAMP domain-containing sensor histidine kinase [Paenibacillus flagellatus]PYI51912.1 hypothetical protein DLM86_23670 [Paenibacillus flagellatus]